MGSEVLRCQLCGIEFHIRSFKRHAETHLPQAVGYLVGNIFFVSLLWYILKSENARRDRGERNSRLKDVDEDVFLGDDDPRWRFQT